ncbi:ABC transporter permease [Flavitalea sp.]|nr:ABC transporter permease [Flavitalea sp.]
MFKNYLKIAWRSIRKNKVSSVINITGLTIGLTCCLLIALYIKNELSYDKFQVNGDRIARVIMEYKIGNDGKSGTFTSTKVFPEFKRQFPEVVSGVRMTRTSRITKYGDKLFDEKKFLFADSTFFEVFSFKLLKGLPGQVLKAPKTIVLTEDAAKKYFGNENPVGKILKTGSDATDFLVTGVMENCPTNSQLKFDMVASFSSLGPAQEKTWWNANYTTYLLLRDPASFASLSRKIPPFMKKEFANEPTVSLNFHLEPYTKVHLHSPHDGFEPNNNIVYIYMLAGIALLILAIACFTYINLSTARSMERAREVGIRKVVGAIRKQIFWQFIGESVLITFIALLLSIGAAILVLPWFNTLADKNLEAYQVMDPAVLMTGIFIIAIISLLAGSYPALILSGFNPVKVLKGAFKNTNSGLWLRKSLTVFQFVISVFLIIATFTIQHQLNFIRNKKLGYDRDQVLVLPTDDKILKAIDLLKIEFRKNGHVQNISMAYNTPNHIKGGYSMKNNMMADAEEMGVTANPVDQDFIKTTGLQLITGTDYSVQDMKDVAHEDESKNVYQFIINESAAAALGWSARDAIGKKMFLGDDRPGFVKGVVKDFHFESLHNPIKPLVLFPGSWFGVIMIKLEGKDISRTIASIGASWKQLVPHRPFEYHFLDEDFNKMYMSEMKMGQILNVFAGMAVLLACLGLFGLSSYAAQQRIKEIGIRKILGASLLQLASILSKDFVKLALVAFLIAAPLAWLVMSDWLQNFNYRVSLSWWIFLIAGSVSLLIALLTVSIQAIKVALTNPVKNLKTD